MLPYAFSVLFRWWQLVAAPWLSRRLALRRWTLLLLAIPAALFLVTHLRACRHEVALEATISDQKRQVDVRADSVRNLKALLSMQLREYATWKQSQVKFNQALQKKADSTQKANEKLRQELARFSSLDAYRRWDERFGAKR